MLLSAFWHGFYPSYYAAFSYFHYALQSERSYFKGADFILPKKGKPVRKLIDTVFM